MSRRAETWRRGAALSSLALAASLWLPWFHGVRAGGPYDLSGWSSFDSADVGLVIGCAVSLLAVATSAIAGRRVLGVPFTVGIVSAAFAGAEAISGHADGSTTAIHPRVGVYVALACGILLALTAQRCRATLRAG
jgi:hypothetical protein